MKISKEIRNLCMESAKKAEICEDRRIIECIVPLCVALEKWADYHEGIETGLIIREIHET